MTAGVGIFGIDRRGEGADRRDEKLAVGLGSLLELLDIILDRIAHAIEIVRQIGDLEGEATGFDAAIEIAGGDLVAGLGEMLNRLAEKPRRDEGEPARPTR